MRKVSVVVFPVAINFLPGACTAYVLQCTVKSRTVQRTGCLVSKLFKLKKWLTVAEAARHLSIVFGEEVRESDVLRLALDGHLKLSVNFVNHARARCGPVVPMENAKLWQAPSDLASTLKIPAEHAGKPLMMLQGININGKEVLELTDEVVSLDGVYDLPMIGAERLDVEHKFQQLTGGPAVTLSNLEGAFVAREDGHLCQLQDHFEDNESLRKNLKTPWSHPSNFYPAGTLPHDGVLVVRVGALMDLQERLVAAEPSSGRTLPARAQTTYQNIIGGLLDLMLGKTPAGKPQSVFKDQAAIISALLAHHEGKPGISTRTLEEKFAASKRALTEG